MQAGRLFFEILAPILPTGAVRRNLQVAPRDPPRPADTRMIDTGLTPEFDRT